MKMSIRRIFQGFIFQDFICLLPIVILSSSLAIASPVKAQSQPNPKTNASNIAQNIIYVNSQTGTDRPEQGSNVAPFKTITYAMSRVQTGQIIQLAYGTYSITSGEKFPIRVRPNVTLRGDEATKGKGIALVGGGTLLTASNFPRNVAIILEDRSELRGVTVTNPNSRGYGMWIENASPAIANNTFIDNQQDGGLIAGKSTAIISSNQFFRNGSSGLAIEGEASPNVRENLFQQNIFGMSIRQDATTQITENTFTQNQSGILIQANAKPILRSNGIINNRNYGLMISDMASPDLGKNNDNGNNTFQGNGILDLQSVGRNTVIASGNQLDIKRAKGNLQLLNVRLPSNQFTNISSAKLSVLSQKNDRFANINQQLEQSIPLNFAPNLDASAVKSSSNLINNQASNPFWYESVTSTIIRITPRSLNLALPANTEISSSLPPVRSQPPSGEPVNQPIQIAPLSNTSMNPQTPSRYRVVVPVSSPNAVARVRQIVPNSFPSQLNGYLVVQIGAYSDRNLAEIQVSRVAQQGLSARIEAIKP